MEILELMKQRHSVRQYKDIAIGPEQRIALNHLIEEINGEAGLHIQIFYDEPQCFDSMMAHYGKFSGLYHLANQLYCIHVDSGFCRANIYRAAY